MNRTHKVEIVRKKRLRGARKMVRLSVAAATLNPFGLAFGVHAVVAQPFVSCSRAIQFGRVMNCDGGGIIGVKPTGTAITDGCIVPLGDINFGKCNVEVSLPQTQSIQMSFSQTKINMTGAGMAVLGNFNIATEAGGHAYTFAASSFTTTQKVIAIGGTMTISDGQEAGGYSGSLNVMVSFP